MKEIIKSQEITFPKLQDNNQMQFMILLSIEFDFGNIIGIDYEFSPSVIKVTTDEFNYLIHLVDIKENHTEKTMKIVYSIFAESN